MSANRKVRYIRMEIGPVRAGTSTPRCPRRIKEGYMIILYVVFWSVVGFLALAGLLWISGNGQDQDYENRGNTKTKPGLPPGWVD
jgi:hypothetical protein